MSGHWPPEWEDPGEEFPKDEARLSEVAAYLASVPAPVLPDTIAARIGAALAAEAATRAGAAPQDDAGGQAREADGSRTLGPFPPRTRVGRGRHRGGGRGRQGFRSRPVMAVGSLVVCLLLAGLGYGLSQSGVKPAYSSSAAAPAAGSDFGSVSSSAARSSATGASAAAGSAIVPEAGPTAGASFVVVASGTKYQQATLAGQVRARLPANREQGASAPSTALRGCVLHATGGTVPLLADRATYQGEPAYVIASSTRVWVVGLGCTAAKTELIVSVALAGLPGNLRALVSVEQ